MMNSYIRYAQHGNSLIASKIAYQWFNNVLTRLIFNYMIEILLAEEAVVKISMIINISTISIIYLKFYISFLKLR